MIQLGLDQRGQASIEFILVTLVALIIIGGMVSIVSNESQMTQTGDLAQARITGEKIAEVINTVYINGPGYNINLTVPNNMTVYVNNPTGNTTILTVISNATGQNISVKLIPKNVQNVTLSSGNVYRVFYNATSGIITIT